jgi:hypothetical protein
MLAITFGSIVFVFLLGHAFANVATHESPCTPFRNTGFNVTSEASSSLLGPEGDWTWHTGMLAGPEPSDLVSQGFWIESIGKNLYSNTSNQTICAELYFDLSLELSAKMADDKGDCNTMLGEDCAKQLRDAVGDATNLETDTVSTQCTAAFDFELPKACKALEMTSQVRLSKSALIEFQIR